MKRFILALAILVLWADPSHALIHTFSGLTGGASANLDGIPSTKYDNGDIAIGIHNSIWYIYEYDSSSATDESSPSYIKPDDNSGNGRWILRQWGTETIPDGAGGEPDLGNPDSDGYLLSSTTEGVRSWVAPAEANHDAVTLGATLGTNLLGLTSQELSLDTQTANYVFAGPESGVAAVPAFRALVDADIPSAIARDTELPTAASLSTDDLITLSGVATGAQHFGDFTGSILTSDQDAKEVFQEIEDYLQSLEDGKQDILAEGSFEDGDKTKLDTIEEGAEVNPGVIPQAEVEAGVATTERLINAAMFKAGVLAHAAGVTDTKGWDYTVRTEAPTGDDLIAGKVYRADNDTWDPITYTGPAGSETVDYYVIYTSAGTWIGVIDLLGNLLIASLPADSVLAATINDGEILPAHLDASNSPTEVYNLPSYNVGTGAWTWLDASGGAAEVNNLETVTTGIADTEVPVGNGAGTVNYVALSGAVTMANTGAVTISNDAIDSQHYAAGSIDNEHLAANSVDSDQYVDGSIDPVHLDLTAAWDFGGASTFEIPNSAANDATLAATGQMYVKDTDDGFAVHAGSNGVISGEVFLPFVTRKEWTFDPKAVCDGNTDRLALMTIGNESPNGIKILAWKVSFLVDPTTEVDLDLKRADAFIGVANSAVVDVLDTTTGLSYETTPANINAGAAVANGKVLYLEFGTPYVAEGEQVILELWYYAEED